jgi:predicted nucleic acid-binding protein
MHQILVDSDVILDLFLDREPHHSVALRFFSHLDANPDSVSGFMSPVAVANVAYILTKAHSRAYAVKKMIGLRDVLRVAPMSESNVDAALQKPQRDFEDTLQYQCARENGLKTIITRNIQDYPAEGLSVLTPREFLAMDIVDKST